MSAARSGPRSSATPTTRWCCSPARRSAAGRSSGSRAGARTTRARSTAATTSPTSRSPATRDGEITGLRVKTLANLGGRLSTIGPGIPTTLYARVLSGCYKIPNVYAEVTGVYTNTTFVDAYRGAGRPEATYVIERAMDLFAAEIGMDRAELRRRNFIQPDQFPYENPSGLGTASGGAKIYIDSGNYEPAMDKALEMAGYADLAAKKAEAKARGKLLGVGLSTYIEVCGVAPSKWIGAVGEGWGAAMWESANIKMHLTGKTVVTMGTQPQGQGHETTYSQVDLARAGHPDGRHRRPALGHAGHAVRLRLVRQPHLVGRHAPRRSRPPARSARRPAGCAAHMLEASVDDIEIDGANYFVKGSPDRVKTIQEIAFALDLAFDPPEGMEPYLDETAYYDTPNCTWPFGTHIAIVEIDEETGHVELIRYLAVDDVGKKINPMIVDGQLHGGIAQGVGQALWEGAIYDDQGQLLTRLDDGLHGAARLVLPEHRARRDRHAVAGQPARGEGRRRGRRDREHGGGRQRGHRCAQPARHPPSRHAVHAADRVARDARLRREARRDPGSVRLPARGLDRRGAGDHRLRPGGEGAGRRPEPPPAAQAPPRLGRDARGHRPRAGAARRPPARRWAPRDRRPDDLRRAARVAGEATTASCVTRCRTSATSRSATAARSAAPSPTPIRRRTCRPACSRSTPSWSSARRAASGRPPIDGFFEGAFTTGLGQGEILTEIRLPGPRDDAGSAYATLQQPASGYALVGVAAVVFSNGSGGIAGANVALTGVGEMAYRAPCGRGGARRLGRLDRFDRGRCRATRPTGSTSRPTSTPTVNIAPRWLPSTRGARSRPPSLGCADRPAGIPCRSNASLRGSVRPRASSGRSLRVT